MDVNERVVEFMKKAGAFFYATSVDGKAKVRPFGFCAYINGKAYFGMGKHKRSYQETVDNPYVEICALAGDEWLRVSGKAVFDWDPATEEQIFAEAPFLRDKYGPESELTHAALYLEDMKCEYMNFGMPDNTFEYWT